MLFEVSALLCLVHLASSKYVGDSCRLGGNAQNGTCSIVEDCPVAVRSLIEHRKHFLPRCGFRDHSEIVCCPMETVNKYDTETKATTSQRIADRECKKIVDSTIPPLTLHIIGGEIAAQGEFPHMAALGYERDTGYTFDCGGALISTMYVLTAAHCIDNLERIEPTIVRLGVVEIGGSVFNSETDIRVAQAIKHPKYTRQEKYNDIALLRLSSSIKYSPNLSPACLYTAGDDPDVELTVTGWGRMNDTRDIKSNILLKANVTAVSREECAPHYTGPQWRRLGRGIVPEQICAGDRVGQRDTCQGDSGGPMQAETTNDSHFRVIGVTSFGRGCGSKVPGVYTRVYSYLDWIESVVWPQ